jgi:hypothetical protein
VGSSVVGTSVGLVEGDGVGWLVGACVMGGMDGIDDGKAVGSADGRRVGNVVGTAVGCCEVGLTDGT